MVYLDMHSAELGVIAVDQGVIDSFAKSTAIISRHPNPEHTQIEFALFIANLKGFQDPFQSTKQRPTVKVVDTHFIVL
jgi:hypothetical protein